MHSWGRDLGVVNKMEVSDVDNERWRRINTTSSLKRYGEGCGSVLYWMSRDQRVQGIQN